MAVNNLIQEGHDELFVEELADDVKCIGKLLTLVCVVLGILLSSILMGTIITSVTEVQTLL